MLFGRIARFHPDEKVTGVSIDDVYFENLASRLHLAVEAQRNCERPQPDASSPGYSSTTTVGTAHSAATGPVERAAAGGSSEQMSECSRHEEISSVPAPGEFWPLAPADWAEMKLTRPAAEEFVVRCLFNRGAISGREIADQIAVPFGLLGQALDALKASRLLVLRGAAQLGDYIYQLTESGMEAAARSSVHCAYDGAVPIVLQDYIDSVHAQSIHKNPPNFSDIARVFQDLVLSDEVLEQVGQAIRAGDGFFLYGDSGNGKTSLAERVCRAFGKTIWIPRSLSVDGTIIRLFDPCNHVEVPPENKDGLYDKLKIDRRWVRIQRPTILAGGELTMDRLEIRPSGLPGINEAPLQLKSNGGTLVIDDFGRQRMRPAEVLNRWIVPLDRRYDFLSLANGKTIQVPFDQLLIFSTNMRPQELADEAFLRRIPYKIRIVDPTRDQFKELIRREAARLEMVYNEDVINDLIEVHYVSAGRPLRCCHGRDLMQQIKHYCEFKQIPLEMTAERFAIAARNYFAATS
jgi:predicted ATPase with chaperone activity